MIQFTKFLSEYALAAFYISACVLVSIKETYFPADSKYTDNGKLEGSENDSAAYNIIKTTKQSAFTTMDILQQNVHTQ